MRCLLIDCDQSQAVATAVGLREEGCKVAWAGDLHAATEALQSQIPDAIVIDRFPPDENCAAAIRQWRASGVHVPIMMIVDAKGLDHRITCLDAGMDGVLIRPFAFAELAARLRALARASTRLARDRNDPERVGLLDFDLRKGEVSVRGELIPLPPRQFKLLAELAQAAGSVVSRQTLFERVWGLAFDPGTKVLETHVSHLRAALERAGVAGAVQTIRGGGYQLNVVADAEAGAATVSA